MDRAKKTMRIVPKTDALLVIDAQTGFMPGGGLAVDDGDLILEGILRVHHFFAEIFGSLDRHPPGHISLASSYVGLPEGYTLTREEVADWMVGDHVIAPHARFTMGALERYLDKVGFQILWPDHCLEGTAEAEMHPALSGIQFSHVVIKGMDPVCDSYSAVSDNLGRSTDLLAHLRAAGVKRLYLCGLAFDFCVGWTARDLAAEGFKVYVLEDATRSVDRPGTVDKMRKDLDAAGVTLIQSTQLRPF